MAIGMTKLDATVVEAAEEVAAEAIEWASDTGGTVLDAGTTEIFNDVILQVSVTFHASATGDAILHLRTSADSGTTEDTADVETYAKTIAVSAGNTVIVSHLVPGQFDYLDVGMENEDGTYVLDWSCKYSGSKMTGLATV